MNMKTLDMNRLVGVANKAWDRVLIRSKATGIEALNREVMESIITAVFEDKEKHHQEKPATKPNTMAELVKVAKSKWENTPDGTDIDITLGEIVESIIKKIGYEVAVVAVDDEEAEFKRWYDLQPNVFEGNPLLDAWKAGRIQLRESLEKDKVAPEKAVEPEWIPWGGGRFSPVRLESRVEIKFRNGEIETNDASRFVWSHSDPKFSGSEYDIIAYRVVEDRKIETL